MKKRYRTKHRDKLLEFFSLNRSDNYRVADLKKVLDQEGYRVGIATLYRQVAALFDEGYLGSIQSEDSAESYYYVGKPSQCVFHYHLKCLECGKLYHLDCHVMEAMEEHVEGHHLFIIDRKESTLYGRCIACTERMDK